MSDYLTALREATAVKATQQNWSYLIAGVPFSGKTTLCGTARGPIVVYCFDPNGAGALVRNSRAIVREYVDHDPNKATAFDKFEKDFLADEKAGLFNESGTVVIDSLTTFCDAIMACIKQKSNRLAGKAQLDDYMYLMGEVHGWCRKCMGLPCDFILTAHTTKDKDDITGQIITAILMTGKAADKLPALFDEWYVMQQDKGKYMVLTKPDGLYNAGTRMDIGHKFDKYEEPDLMAMRKKAGFPVEHKP